MGEANRFRTLCIAAVSLLMLVVWIGARIMVSEQQVAIYDFEHKAGRRAVHSTVVTVPREEWDTYFDKMREFANGNGLKVRIKRLKPGFDIFFVDLWRPDAALTGGNVFDTPDFHTHFYIDSDKGGTPEMAAALVESMREFVSQVPGVTIKQTK